MNRNKAVVLRSACMAIAVLCISACAPSSEILQTESTFLQPDGTVISEDKQVSLSELDLATGQVVYVPSYSHTYFLSRDREGAARRFPLATTLSVRNTDLSREIIVVSVDYYDTSGELVKRYFEKPLRLSPLATLDFFVDEADNSGGSGANFIVKWVAETEVSEPIAEAVMIGSAGNQGLSFLSSSRVVMEWDEFKEQLED